MSRNREKSMRLRAAMQVALQRSNYACETCRGSYRKNGVRTHCRVISFERLEVIVICDDCEQAERERRKTIPDTLPITTIVREVEPAYAGEPPPF
jgi:hypothetical protein